MFGDVANGEMILNDAGKSVECIWNDLSKRFPTIMLDEHVIMPNHMHGIIFCRGEPCVRPEIRKVHTYGRCKSREKTQCF